MAAAKTSPKVTVASITAAVVTLAMYLLNQIPAIESMPEEPKGALLVIVAGAVTFAAGWLKPDDRSLEHGQTPQD